MIVRPRPHWFRMLFIWKGSVLRKLLPRLAIIFAISIFALATHRWLADPGLIDLSAQPFTLLGIALAIFLGFRTNVSHDRYWEARKLWGSALIATRALARQALTLTTWTQTSAEARRFVQGLIAHTHALRHQLRDSDAKADLLRLLAPADFARVVDARYKPAMLLLLLGEQLRAVRQQGVLSDQLSVAIERNLDTLGDVVGGCERIAGTPIPLTFSVMVHRTIYFYCSLLPFALIPSIGWYTPVFSVFVAYTFMALEAIAEELESPFGTEANDLPLMAMSQMIEATLVEMLGDMPPADRAGAGGLRGALKTAHRHAVISDVRKGFRFAAPRLPSYVAGPPKFFGYVRMIQRLDGNKREPTSRYFDGVTGLHLKLIRTLNLGTDQNGRRWSPWLVLR